MNDTADMTQVGLLRWTCPQCGQRVDSYRLHEELRLKAHPVPVKPGKLSPPNCGMSDRPVGS